MARLVGDCPFCGEKKVVINEEHAFAQWTLRLVIAQRGRDARFRIRVKDGPEYSSRYPELIVYGPCKTTCNGGWMRSLEDRARPFMGDMITDGRLTFLDDVKTRTLTLWTVKTAMVFEYRSNVKRRYFTDEDRVAMRNGHLPNAHDIYVWATRFSGRAYSHFSIIDPVSPADDTTPFRGFVVTMNLRQLALQLLAVPRVGPRLQNLTCRPGPWDGALVQLFPHGSPEPLIWPANAEELYDSDLELFGRRLGSPRTRQN